MNLSLITRRAKLVDGSARFTTRQSWLNLFLSGFLLAPELILWPPKNTYLFDVTRQKLHVAYGHWAQSQWSVPFSDITRVWLSNDGPSVFERFTVMVTANNKTYSLFMVQGFWLSSTALDDIRRAMAGCDVAIESLTPETHLERRTGF
ncbi:MAG: hypothetical protein K1X64_04775 [Myxococcaceae bacterium]|nr:hypothetical protein [Myxococcaceae bacterium]